MILSLELALALELSIYNVTSFEKEVMQILVQIGREERLKSWAWGIKVADVR